jgi:hypothetical protein
LASTPENAGIEAIMPGKALIETPYPARDRPAPPDRLARLAASIRSATVERKFLWILLVLFVAKGVIFTFTFPAFSGHDEVAHYSYLQFVAEEGRPPVIPDVKEWQAEYDQTRDQRLHDHMPQSLWKYCAYVTRDWKFCDVDEYVDNPVYAITVGGEVLPAGWVYTANHPPLYYLTMTPIYWLSSGGSIETQLYILRLAAIPFGLITVLFAYMTTRVLFPASRFMAVAVPAFVAFQPQVSYEAAMLNNDIFSIAFTSIVFYLLAVGLRKNFPWRTCILIGLFFGLAMLSKNTSAVSGLVIAIAMILSLGIRNVRQWVPKGVVTAVIGGLLIWPWYLYMRTTYGDFTALARIKDLQRWWNYGGGKAPSVWAQLTDKDFAWMRWRETWGEFGWRLIPLDKNLLWLIFWFCVIGLVGLVWWTIQTFLARSNRTISFRTPDGGRSFPAVHTYDSEQAANGIDPIFRLDRPARIAILTLLLACIVAYYAVLQFGTTFSLTQARYYFPSINAAAILIMLGYRSLLPRRWLGYSQAAFFLAFAVLNIIIFSQYVIPYWHSGL